MQPPFERAGVAPVDADAARGAMPERPGKILRPHAGRKKFAGERGGQHRDDDGENREECDEREPRPQRSRAGDGGRRRP